MGVLLLVPVGILALLSPPLVAEGMWSDMVFDLFGWLFFAAGSPFRIWSTLCWICLPYVGELIAHLRVETWWPHFLRLP